MIEYKNVSLALGGRTIIHPCSLSLPSAQTHVLVGSSGCGKSTLLRLTLGLFTPDNGKITIDGTVVSAETQNEIVSQTGYVVQDGGLFPHMTAKENVTLVARLKKWDAVTMSERIQELLKIVNLEESILDHFPRQLSGGQKQRVSLMRALFLDPNILLLDEPLGALDPIIRVDLQEELKTTFDALKKTVILVTHDLGEASFFGHTVTLMDQGKIVQHGSFENLVKNPADTFVSKFLRAQRPNPWLKDLL